ncbi:MAG TPA: hypothetical protein VFC82_06575 [Actinomycetaceae bacterium]|nr:hypothetical protein [Actinomycetaceae bacterium]
MFARATAAAIWGIPLLGGYPAIPTECRSRLTGGFKLATSRVVTTKTDFEVVEVGGLLVTAPSRTIIDMALAHPFESALISADHALRANLVTQEQLLAEIDAASGRPGRAAARRVIERASPIPESVGESLSRARFYQLGAPEPILQKSFYDKEGFAGRPDMYFEQADCIGEFDGEGKYRRASRPGTDPADVLVDEKLREDRLRCLVKGFIRWTWKDALKWRPLEEKLRSAGVLYGKPVRLFGLK